MGPARSIAVLLAAAAAPALAQNTTAPTVITPPAIERFTLPPQAAPTPSPSPTPTPTPVPSPSASASPVAPPPVVPTAATPGAPSPSAPRASSTPQPRSAARATPTPTPSEGAAPEPTATPLPAPIASPGFTPPIPVPSAAGEALATPSGAWGWWPGFAIAAVVAAAIAIFVLLRRRRTGAADDAIHDELPVAAPAPGPQPGPPARPLTTPIATPLASASVPPADVTISLEAGSLVLDERGAAIDFVLTVINATDDAVDAVRPVIGVTTASAVLPQQVAEFAVSAPLTVAIEPFTLQPGEARRIDGEMVLPRAEMHVASAGGRPMIVPVAMTVVRWRAGLSIRSAARQFMLGTGDGQGGKLGPIFLDRGARRHSALIVRGL